MSLPDIKRGTLELNAKKRPINTSASAEEAARVAAGYNDSEFLRHTFFEPNETTLDIEELPSGGKVTVMIPSGPYTEGSVMVIAAGRDSLRAGQTGTEVIYDLPQDVQKTYWETAVILMNHLQHYPGLENVHIMAVENCMNQITSPQERNSRTIRLPHMQILLVDEEHIKPDDWKMPHLDLERRVLRQPRLMTAFLRNLGNRYRVSQRDTLQELTPRLTPPLGYSFEVGPMTDFNHITQVMAAHHQVYAGASQQAAEQLHPSNRERLIRQPSYRLILNLKGNRLFATVSPEFLSPAGVMEAMDVRLNRDEAHPQRKSDQELTIHYQDVEDALAEMKKGRVIQKALATAGD